MNTRTTNVNIISALKCAGYEWERVEENYGIVYFCYGSDLRDVIDQHFNSSLKTNTFDLCKAQAEVRQIIFEKLNN